MFGGPCLSKGTLARLFYRTRDKAIFPICMWTQINLLRIIRNVKWLFVDPNILYFSGRADIENSGRKLFWEALKWNLRNPFTEEIYILSNLHCNILRKGVLQLLGGDVNKINKAKS